MIIFQPSDITMPLMQTSNTPNAFVTNHEGKLAYFQFPHINSHLPKLDVRLKLGYPDHSKGAKKYGLRHIWDSHKGSWKSKAPSEIIQQLGQIIKPCSEILMDTNYQKKIRPIIYCERIGMVVLQLEWYQHPDPHYSIVTAYPAFKRKGNVIGRL
jgi:hypothetical protein